MDKDHNLCIELNKRATETLGDKLTLQTEIIGVSKNSLAVSLTTRTKDNAQSIYILELKGAWQADKNNRLTFLVQKEKGSYDVLTFKGAWEINKNNQIVYKYEKAQLIRKQKQINTLTFKGYWDIKDKARISYVLDAGTDYVFNFKTSAGIFKDKYIKYELGIGVGREQAKRTLTLSGKWQIRKNMGLTFEIEYEARQVHAIIFGAKAELTAKDSISFELKNEKNKDISAQVQLSRKMLDKDGLSFLRFLKSKDEAVVSVGAGFRW